MSNSLEAKIVVLGSQGVGKTSLVHRYVKNAFQQSIHSTIGASFLTKRVVDSESSTVVRLQIWDTAGQERFRSISKLYYRGANAALLCYDITSAASFTEMTHWLLELRANLPEDTILHVVGTKSDIVAQDPSKRDVTFERCIAYVAENLYPSTAANGQAGHLNGKEPPLNTPAIERTGTGLPFLGGGKNTKAIRESAAEPLGSPPSNRSSMNFWGQDLGWDCCHEISASTGEGVEEVFRVITRRLVEQRNSRAALEMRLAEELGMRTAGLDERGDYFGGYDENGMNGNGSFRVGMGDKRRSWLGLAQFPSLGGSVEEDEEVDTTNARRRKRGCC
ncbi:ras-domain-containing protein [Venturia nashicola]|uniref:Ras-domain-containing protein n=1 Tax=Venturia nashicola TaxID=86259 RepID=A0A4Z1P8Q7_9PEZI|nr:ras-domain-containing protein [Venturia nashicola]